MNRADTEYRKDIISMARDAGFVDYELDDGTDEAFDIRYVRFATLVAEQAKAEEREACAKVCDAINAVYKKPEDKAERVASQWCAERIRARGQA